MSMYEVKRDFISQYVILCAVILLWVTDSGATQVQQWDSLNTLELTSEGVSDLDQSTTILEDQSVCMNGGQGRTSWLLWFFFERWTSKSTYGFPLKEGQPTNFNFKLSHAPTTDVTVTITDESIYPAKLEFSKKTLTFTTTNWCQSQNVTIKFMDNDTVDDYENKRARASFSLQGEGVRTDGYTIDYVDLIDEEREKAFIKVRPNVLKMKEGEKKPYYIKLGTPPSGTVTIKIPDIEENYHLIHDKDELIFNKGSWDTEQEVMVTSARDDNWNFSVVSYPLTAEGSGYDDVKTNVIVEIKDIDKPLTANIRGLPKKINTKDVLTAQFNFARDVTGFETDDITVTGGTKGATLSGSGDSHTLPITPNGSENVVVAISKNAATDGVVNGPAKRVTKTAVWDANAPTITISGIPGKINSTNNLTATFTFSVPVTDFEINDIIVQGGKKDIFTEVSSTVYTLVITPIGNANVVVTVKKNAASDGINLGPKVPVKVMAIWDSVAPTLDITGLPGKINTTADLTATFTFSESVTGFESNDITVDGGTKKDFDGSGKSYTLVITPSRGQDIKVTVPANAATDGLNEGPPRDVYTFVTWHERPNVIITGIPESINSTDPLTATFKFGEDVMGFNSDDVVVNEDEGTKGTFTQVSPSEYTLVVTPKEGKSLHVTVPEDAAIDADGFKGPVGPVTAMAIWDADPDVAISGLPEKIYSTEPLTVIFTFTEYVTGFTTEGVTVAEGTKGVFGGSGSRYTLIVTPINGKDLTLTVKANAATDGLNTGPPKDVTKTAIWDDPPDVVITGIPEIINSTDPLTATFTFTEDVTGFGTGDLNYSGLTKGDFTEVSSSEYTLVVTPKDGEDLLVEVPVHVATDTDGIQTGPIQSRAAGAIWDATAPDVMITGLPDKINSTEPLTATFTFTEEVTGFEADDVTVSEGTKGAFDGSGMRYTLVLTPESGKDLTVTVAADAATDGLNMGPTDAVSVTVTWDDNAPNVIILGLPDKINSTSDLTATFTFNEKVTGFEADDVTVSEGTKGAFAGIGTNYTLVLTPTSGEDLTVIVAADAATDGLNTGPTSPVSHMVIWDATAPDVTITELPDKINSTEPLTAIFTFTEDVTGFTTEDVTVSGATKDAFTASSATTYTLGIQPLGTGDVTVTVARDAASDGVNTGPTDAVSATVTWDGATPGVTISDVPEKINSRTTFMTTFTFSEEVTGFIVDDVMVSGATKGASWSAHTETVYTLSVTPSGDQDVVVTVPPNVATDGTNTGPTTAVSATAIWDNSVPTVTITGLPQRITTVAPLTVTFIFSEEVTGFVAEDIEVTAATKGSFTGTQKRYTLVVTPTGISDVVVTVNADVVTDGLNTGPPNKVTAKAIWDPERIVTLTASSNQVQEGQSVRVNVNLTGAPFASNIPIPLRYPRLLAGAATEPADYTQLRSITIEAGKNIGSGIIATRDDDVYEGDELFEVAFGDLPDGLTRGNPDSQTITIEDRTIRPTATLSAEDVSEGEEVTVTVTLSRSMLRAVTIPLTLIQGTATASEDYQIPRSLSVTIAAGKTQANLGISTLEDQRIEEAETFTIAFGDLPSTVQGSNAIVVTIIEDTKPELLTVSSIAIVEGGSNTLQVSLSATPSASVTVTMHGFSAPLNVPSPPRLIFTPQDWDQPQDVELTADMDPNITNEERTLILTANGGGYVAITKQLLITITDKDVAQLVVQSFLNVPEGGTSMLNISLASAPVSLTTVTLEGNQHSTLTIAPPPPLTFSTMDWNQSRMLTFQAAEDDNFVSESQALTIRAMGYTDQDVTSSLRVTMEDNDQPELKVTATTLLIQEGGTGEFQVVLNGEPSSDVVLSFSGYTGLRPVQSLTFTPADWGTQKTVILEALEDENDFEDEAFDLTLMANGGEFNGLSKKVSITIEDDDVPLQAVILSINDKRVREDEKKLQLEVELSRATDEVVTVQYESSDLTAEAGADYTASRGFVIFDPQTTRGVIQFDIHDDENPEGEETFEVTLSNPKNAILGRATATATILDPNSVSIVRIEDAVTEGDAMHFAVHIFPPSSKPITVHYQTEDGTAKAGEDYQATSGILEITPAEETMMIQVPLLVQEVTANPETFTVRLNTSEPIELEKAVATAIITEDVLPAVDTSEIMNAYTARFIRTAASEIVEGVGHRLKNQSSTCSAASRHETARLWHSAWTPPLSELLSGCHMTSTHGSVQVWGRGAYRRFHGQEEGDGLQVEANVSTAMAGGDYRWRSGWLTGVLVSHSRSDGAYQFYDVRDEIDASMTGIYPYLSYQTKTWGIWGTGGISRGRTEIMFRIDPTLGNIGIPLGQTTIRNVQRLERSWLAGFGAIGVQGVMAMVNALRLRYYGDVMIISTELDDQRVGVVRIRAGMEASAPLTTGLHPYVEAGVRQDAGSAENGVGLELGAGMRVAIPALRLRGDLRTQSLMVHSAEGFTEWGISGSLEFGNQHKGFGLRVTPSLGPSHRRGIYTQQTIRDATATQDGIYRTEMEFGYGIPFQETVIRSVMGVTSFDRGRIYRLGGELRSWGSFSVSAFGMVHTHQNASRNLGINLQAALDD